MQISILKYPLHFKQAAGTSRGILRKKNTWFIKIQNKQDAGKFGLGEINMFQGLSYDDRDDFYSTLKQIEEQPEKFLSDIYQSLVEFPAIRFGLETALLDYHSQQQNILFPSEFTKGKTGIPINGLIWMGDETFMKAQIKAKLDLGYRCLKMKIGAINFDTELQILQSIRKEYTEENLELRVDANGAFEPNNALRQLEILSSLDLHSIEQPIKQGNWEMMQTLCKNTPLPIALDEELIGINDHEKKKELIDIIKPQYIILKPALVGGFKASEEWISIADTSNVKWWVTSALESNVGLNAIAQWTYALNTNNFQGLGTGQLFTNNIDAPLYLKEDQLFYHPQKKWQQIFTND